MDGANNFENEMNWRDLDEASCNQMASDGQNEHLYDEMVKRQFESDQDLSEPCLIAERLLDHWSQQSGHDARMQWEAAVDRYFMNNQSHSCPEWEKLLNTDASITYGAVFTSKGRKRKSTKEDGWRATKMPWRKHIAGRPTDGKGPGWGLGRSIEDDHKDGPGIILGDCNQRRAAAAVSTICAFGLDIDSGHATFDEACERARRLGFGFIAYTTHSHLKTETELNHDAVVKFAGSVGEPTLEAVKNYLAATNKFAPQIIASVKISERNVTTPNGWVIRLKHDPIHKYRFVFPFLEGDVPVQTIAGTQQEAMAVYKRKIKALANALGLEIDKACLDISRFFYSPRHKPGSVHENYVYQAPPLSFFKSPEIEDDEGPRERVEQRDVVTACGTNISKLSRAYKKRWRVTEIMQANDLGTTASASDSDDKYHVRCPFSEGHTDPSDDSATCVFDPDPMAEGANEYARMKCQHGSCDGRKLEDFLGKWIEDGAIDASDLEDPAFMHDFADNQEEGRYFQKTPSEAMGESEARKFIREQLQGEDVHAHLHADAEKDAITHLIELGASRQDAEVYVSEAISDVLRQIEQRVEERSHDPVASARHEATSLPQVLESPYDLDLVDEDNFIVRPEDTPAVYRKYQIDPKSDDAYVIMQAEIRDQIFNSMTDRFAYVVTDGEARVAMPVSPGERVKLFKEQTLQRLYANRNPKYWIDEDDLKKKPKIRKLMPHSIFVEGKSRQTYFDTCCEPNERKAALAAQNGAFNLWTGFAVEPQQGDWSLLREHIRDVVCQGNVSHFNWFMTWLASLFARPGTKVPSSIAIIGEQGTGKSKVFDWVRRGIGAGALKVSAMRHLTGNFNAHLDGLVLLVCEEAFWGGNKSEGGVIKDLISSDTLQIEGKFQNVVERPNYVNSVFISNNKWTVPVDGEDARRFFVLAVSDAKKKDAPYFGAIDDQMENGGLEAMVYDLMNWNPTAVGLNWSDLRYPPVTKALREQAGMGLTGPAERLVSILENGVLEGRDGGGDTFYYDLSDEMPTDVAKSHMVAALHGSEGRGNISQEMKDAIEKFLGVNADHGDNKQKIIYLGEFRHQQNEDGMPVGEVRKEKCTSERVRYITVPALNDLREVLTRFGRG